MVVFKELLLTFISNAQSGYFNISADRLFTFEKHLTINSREVDPKKPQVDVAKLRFTVSVKSVVVARVGFQYTLNELRLSLINNVTNSEEAFVVTSRPYKNFNEIDLVVEPGSYTVVIDLIKPSLVWSKLAAKGHRCVPYTLSVLVDDVTRGGSPPDCSQYHVVPLNLDNVGGGSTPFGGPMKNGYVHIASDKFLASGLIGTATATNTMVRAPCFRSAYKKQKLTRALQQKPCQCAGLHVGHH
jgi:hypothetical protein